MTKPRPNGYEAKSRLLAKLVRELLASEQFETLADLTDALKVRCARLKLGWTNDAITDCYRLVASNLPLVVHMRTAGARAAEKYPVNPSAPQISRDEARDILARLGVKP